ncbi:MAG: S1 family peptidase [Propionibacteriaceae bacterium]
MQRFRRHSVSTARRGAGTIVFLAATLAAVGLNAAPASAITHGDLDGEDHPAVVLVVMDVGGEPASRCTGTLISPTVVLTAGHCTGEEGEPGKPGKFSGMRVFAESDVEDDDTYPGPGGANTVEASAWHTLPGFTARTFTQYDVGVIELAQPITLPADQYGQLPSLDALDSLMPGAKTTFTAVGFGLQRANPNPNGFQIQSDLVRMVAEPQLLQVNTANTGPQSLLLSSNANTGGTCFGDSGGPNFLGSSMVVAGVTSYGNNGSCGGTAGVFRVDRAEVLAFINGFLG